ncbi:ABC transporter permease [Streptomyces sp. bgisy060]|uniref:ABC transporter permease n=1 Tax=Streptomyces sp. bgisy060 TaxID=3413775 RepID=UPI003EBA12C0
MGRPGGWTVIDVLGSRDARWNGPGQAVLGERTAKALGLKAGQEATVRFADGESVGLRVARVLPDDPARGDFVVARDLVRLHDPAALTDDVFVPGADRPAELVPGTALHDALQYALDDYDTDAELTEGLAAVLIVIAVGYSGIAIVNGMAVAAHGRRRDFAVMRSAGGTVRQLLLLSVGETSSIVAVGALLGVLVALPPLVAMASGLSQVTSVDVGLHLSAGTVAGAILGSLLLAVTAGVAVTWRTVRRDAS